MKIDTLKEIPKHQSCYGLDDMDISEPDTALSTPTGSPSDSFSRRFSSCSSSRSSNSYTTSKSQHQQKWQPKNKPSHTEILEKKVQLLEKQICHHVERETELKSQITMLEQKSAYSSGDYKHTLNRVSKHIDRFLVSHDKRKMKQTDDSIWKENTDWSGYELPALFDPETPTKDGGTVHMETEKNTIAQCIAQLKTMINQFSDQVPHMDDDHQSIKKRTLWFCSDLKRELDATWTERTFIVDNYVDHSNTENERVVQLLNALQRSLQRNKVLEKNHAVEIKQYQLRLNVVMQELAQSRALVNNQSKNNNNENSKKRSRQAESLEELDAMHAPCQNILNETRAMFEAQIKTLEGSLASCQEERDEFEMTLAMVRQEMETMLEELEDTRQQRVRYKTQAGRLRAGIDAIQKRKCLDGDEDDDDDDQVDEQKESLILLYNEAERQAVDLERECKRQALTLNSVRQELKLMEEKYHSVKVEKAKDLKQLEIENNKIKRQVQVLELEKSALYQREQLQQQKQEQQPIQEKQINKRCSKPEYDEIEDSDLHYYLLQVAFEAAQADTIAQRTRIGHLEKECLLTKRLDDTLQQLHGIFEKELEKEHAQVLHLIKQIKTEQSLWKEDKSREYQKKYDADTVATTREIRWLSSQLSDIEDEIALLKDQHMNELALLKKEYTVEAEKKIQRIVTRHKSEEEDFKKENEVLSQQIQRLQDESLVLYGRNMIMAHELGKFT